MWNLVGTEKRGPPSSGEESGSPVTYKTLQAAKAAYEALSPAQQRVLRPVNRGQGWIMVRVVSAPGHGTQDGYDNPAF